MSAPQVEATVLFPPPGVVKPSSAEVLSSFAVLRGDRSLRVGSHEVPVDTGALSSRSLYFASMFGSDFKEASEIVAIVVEPPKEETFFHVLYYLMTGTMRDLTIENFASIVENAEFVQSMQLLEYLQQVALAYYKQLFAHPSFRPPSVSAGFVKGFLGHAKTANKVRSLFTAVHLLAPWLDADWEQAEAVLDHARQLFPPLPRALEFKRETDTTVPAPAPVVMTAAQAQSQRERRNNEELQGLVHQCVRMSSASHFLQALSKYPKLRKSMTAEETLCALDPILHESRLHEAHYYHGDESTRRRLLVESIAKLKKEAKQSLTQLSAELHPASTSDAGNEDGSREPHGVPLPLATALQRIALQSHIFGYDHDSYGFREYGGYDSDDMY
eukprot:TRINITY_DN111855_c0_g1_i1.p1 TRINITY_DN111855_c0_g1~~TRINITY_DN111855_c0_g1_i1.p1  ORF type:complete len:386 (+),score=73.16 TRINITY_DN111855_c0_g1_i1:134-1291(+)